jgi:serine/threonine protein kinase/Tol biopolymer transport system component
MHLGAYEILALVGAGGMGEVYRARDTRLDRTVAIKVLAASLTGDPQLRERFDREARAISSLNHPHICTLYDVGHHDPSPGSGRAAVDFLVLEYLEGETLAERLGPSGRSDHLREGYGGRPLQPLAPEEALRIGIEICDALDKAHGSGIVHRDLKPANVFLVSKGRSSDRPIAKLLDFGLAKSAAPVVAASGLSMLPTTPPNLTAQGTILGTFQYMAPEQIEGLEADARTDIFAFGALLFEMLTGRPAFEGKTRASLLGAILKDEPPPVSRVQPVAPATLDRIISTCLAKDPDDRYQSARDLLRDLKWVASGSSDGSGARTVTPSARSTRVAWLVAALSTIALIATAVIALRRTREVTSPAVPAQFTIVAPENMLFGGPRAGGTGIATQLAVSPDGRNIVFVAGTTSTYQIWLRPIAGLAARPIPGTEDGAFPFWSPDSRFIGFFAAGKLKKVQITGGPPIVLCDAPLGRGGSWSRENVILFATTSFERNGLQRVSSAGGTPTVVTTVDPANREDTHRWPHFLPDGRHFFYTASTGTCCPASKPGTIRIGSLDPADPTITLLQAESSVSYASRHLLYARDGTLIALPFDPEARQPTGDAFPLAERVGWEGSRYVSASVSENGTLVYGQGSSLGAQQLTWFDRAGRILGTLGEAAPYINLALSPDERRVAVAMGTGSPQNVDIWIIDIARNVRSRLTVDPGTDVSPLWSPDGTRIAFQGSRAGKAISLRQISSDGTGADELLLEGSGNFTMTPSDWSKDGRFIAYAPRSGGQSDIWVLPLFGDRKPFPLTRTPFRESSAAFSPDGRWIAYTTDEDGRNNVYVQPFPGPGAKYPVSRDGGFQPVWRADGKELFYVAADVSLTAVPIDPTSQIPAGPPQALFQFRSGAPQFDASQLYAVTKDGKRFLVNARSGQTSQSPLTVVVNWPATIQK